MSNAARRRRKRRQLSRATKAGQIPGSAVYAGESIPDTPVQARVIDYTPERHEDLALHTVGEAGDYCGADTVSWINVDGVHDAVQVEALCERFGVHPLWIEDIMNPVSRPKAEVGQEQVFVVARVARLLPSGELDTEQISMVLGPGWVLSFQERPGDVWEGVRRRLETNAGRLRRMGSDYLLHALLDAVVDNYFLVVEALEEQVDAREDAAVQTTNGMLPVDFLALKQELAGFRQGVWPMREAIGKLVAIQGSPFTEETAPYYRDLYDHIVQVMDILEATRERLVGVVELHLAMQGQRLNEIMKVLTLVSTVFIPLSFLAGLYGMNFEWMPELRLRWAYPVLLFVMLVLGVSMAVWFRRRKWL